MDARSIIIDLMASGYTRNQIAKQARITAAAVSHILNGKTSTVHRQTLFGLLSTHAAATKVAQRRLEATTHEIKHLEAQVDSLRLAEALKVL